MDEMTQLREFRADAPVPGRGALAPGRRRLLDAASSGRRARRLRADWRLAAVGAAVAITVAAALGTRIVDAAAPGRSGPASASGTLRLEDVAEVLDRAADTLERQPAGPEPLDDQWIYTRTAQASSEGGPDGASLSPVTYVRDWVPYDNSAAARKGEDTDYRTARQVYRTANALPDDPVRLLERARALYPTGHTAADPPETTAQHSFRAVSLMVGTYPIAPAALARIYRATATIPGVHVTGRLVKDAAGREAIAITRKEEGRREQREILLDPRGFHYAGRRAVVTESYTYRLSGRGTPGPAFRLTAGQILVTEALVEASVVDGKGEKP
ncbi:CU044_5270 family protein [Streptomyces sp. NPDC058195]|uniref:CU044_5270 family protein n=1 Tax=Streptomyces sp. NPDC058195 TaxID=3346375 RepID=UPI0036ED9039